MTCKDCVHYAICKDEFPIYVSDHEDDVSMEKECEYYKDKSRFIELPCKTGDTAYLVCYGLVEEITIGIVDMEHSGSEEDICYIEAAGGFHGGYLGETAFLTREEAEKAHKKMMEYDKNA